MESSKKKYSHFMEQTNVFLKIPFHTTNNISSLNSQQVHTFASHFELGWKTFLDIDAENC